MTVTGYACPAGTTTSTPAYTRCIVGQYSTGGAAVCTQCPRGTFGNTTGLTLSSCTGLCAAGYYGSTPAASSPSCSGPCAAGYYCPDGSTSATQAPCAVGQYSTGGAASCTACPAGQFGNATALTTSSCSGPCAPGYYCLQGSTNATAAPCDVGQYSTGGVSVCSSCPGGTFGNATSLTTSSCSGPCAAGYACPAGSTNATAIPCAAGQYSTGGAAACSAMPPARSESTRRMPWDDSSRLRDDDDDRPLIDRAILLLTGLPRGLRSWTLTGGGRGAAADTTTNSMHVSTGKTRGPRTRWPTRTEAHELDTNTHMNADATRLAGATRVSSSKLHDASMQCGEVASSHTHMHTHIHTHLCSVSSHERWSASH